MKSFIEKKKVEKMIKSGEYILIKSGFDLIGLMHKKTNKIYKPKVNLCVK